MIPVPLTEPVTIIQRPPPAPPEFVTRVPSALILPLSVNDPAEFGIASTQTDGTGTVPEPAPDPLVHEISVIHGTSNAGLTKSTQTTMTTTNI